MFEWEQWGMVQFACEETVAPKRTAVLSTFGICKLI